jgi:hypothetical protein
MTPKITAGWHIAYNMTIRDAREFPEKAHRLEAVWSASLSSLSPASPRQRHGSIVSGDWPPAVIMSSIACLETIRNAQQN